MPCPQPSPRWAGGEGQGPREGRDGLAARPASRVELQGIYTAQAPSTLVQREPTEGRARGRLV
eukprot:scaffold582_cov385-Prasinococcus_capsulatus_cf.AAC.48